MDRNLKDLGLLKVNYLRCSHAIVYTVGMAAKFDKSKLVNTFFNTDKKSVKLRDNKKASGHQMLEMML